MFSNICPFQNSAAMPQRRNYHRTTIAERWRCVTLAENGMKAPAISLRLGIPRRTVSDILRRKRANPADEVCI